MVNQTFYELGTAPSVIRQLFAYGLEQAKIVGKENVFDYSIGNPSIPAPKKVNESIHKVVNETDSIQLHGYSMAAGFDTARAAEHGRARMSVTVGITNTEHLNSVVARLKKVKDVISVVRS